MLLRKLVVLLMSGVVFCSRLLMRLWLGIFIFRLVLMLLQAMLGLARKLLMLPRERLLRDVRVRVVIGVLLVGLMVMVILVLLIPLKIMRLRKCLLGLFG
jgi:hypothetical protein